MYENEKNDNENEAAGFQNTLGKLILILKI